MNKYTYDIDSFSDLHKEARGFRPSEGFWQWVKTATPDELQEKWDSLSHAADREYTLMQEMQAEALVRLREELAETTANNRVDMVTAVRWMHDAYSTNGDNEFLDYRCGVAYGTIAKILKGEEI